MRRPLRAARVLVSALLLAPLAACSAGERADLPDTPEARGERILAGAARRLGTGDGPAPTLRTSATVEGPSGTFRTSLLSGRDGWVRMEQRPGGFLAGVGPEGAWRGGPEGERLPLSPASLSVVRGHELHMLALRPTTRFGRPRAVPSPSDSFLAVALERTPGDSLVALFHAADTLPAGLRVLWTEPPVEVRWDGWETVDGVPLFRDATFLQGDERFHYRFDTLEVGPLADSLFRGPAP